MSYTEKQKKEVFKMLQALKADIQESLDYALENIDTLEMDSYFSAEDHLERIARGLLRLEEDFQEKWTREKLKQFETRLFFLEDRFEEVDSELRQRPRRRRKPRISPFDFFRFTQGGPYHSSFPGDFKNQEEAFAAFDLEPGAPLKTVTARFRKMAKALHPDANGGDRSQEPRLRKLIAAYQYIKEHLAPE